MGFLKALGNFGKKVLGGVVGAGNWMRNMRDKAISGFNKVKDMLPDVIKAPLDAGIEFLMNTPIGSAVRKASGLLDTAVGAGESALSKLKEHESRSGTPISAQLQEIGERANASGSEQPSGDEQQQARLTSLKQE